MTYQFSCEQCSKTIEVEIPMSEYNSQKDKQFCPDCNSKLKRVIEWNGMAYRVGGYSEEAGAAKWQSRPIKK